MKGPCHSCPWSTLYPPSLEQFFFFSIYFIIGTFCVLSPGLDTDVSVVSKAGVVPDLWNAMGGGGEALVGSLTYSFIHSFSKYQTPAGGYSASKLE